MASSANSHHISNVSNPKHNSMHRTFTRPWQLFLVAAASSGVNGFITPHPMCPSTMCISSSIHPSLTQRLSTVDGNFPLDVVSASDIVSSEGVHNLLAENSSEVGPDGVIPFAPMMSFQKYLTMQEKRVKVTIRYTADAGLRPFYLTVASRIKAAHPDVILEKRILPNPAVSDMTESIFEVLVDGKIVIGKKKTKLLKVRTSSSSSSSRNEDDDDDNKTKDKNESSDSDIAGGRSIFVSMEKLEHELNKARKKRRPSTMYKSKDLLRTDAPVVGIGGSGEKEMISGTSEAVLRLEKLKAMSSRKN